jgi:hypothetical protein
MDRFQRLLQKHEECLQDKERMNTQLDEQHSLLRSMARSMQITPTTTSDTAEKSTLSEHTTKVLLSKRISHLLESDAFTGTPPQDVSDWLDGFEDKCDKVQLNDEQKFSIVQDLLKGSAKMWFDTHKTVINNWQLFKKKVKAHFELIAGVDPFERYKQLYNRRRHNNESSIDYFHNVIKLCLKANETMDEATQIKHMLNGLSLRAKSYIEVRKPDTTEHFLQVLIECDKVLAEEDARQAPTAVRNDQYFTQGKTRVSMPVRPMNNNLGRSYVAPQLRNSNYSYHQYYNNPYYASRTMNRSNDIGCWSCGSHDHYENNCPKNY